MTTASSILRSSQGHKKCIRLGISVDADAYDTSAQFLSCSKCFLGSKFQTFSVDFYHQAHLHCITVALHLATSIRNLVLNSFSSSYYVLFNLTLNESSATLVSLKSLHLLTYLPFNDELSCRPCLTNELRLSW